MSSEHPYLDVMTVRPSESGRFSGSIGSSQQYLSLLVEPVILPEDLSHLSIDKAPDDVVQSEVRFFYPSGKKNVNMRRVIEKNVQEGYNEAINKHRMAKRASHESTQILPKHKHVYTKVAKPKEPLYYGRKVTNSEKYTEELLNTLRYNEAKITQIIKPIA